MARAISPGPCCITRFSSMARSRNTGGDLFPSSWGIALGVPLALAAAQYAKSLLFGIDTADPLTIVVSIAVMIGVAALAGYLPARRALRVDPMVALRYE